eukprot:25967_1
MSTAFINFVIYTTLAPIGAIVSVILTIYHFYQWFKREIFIKNEKQKQSSLYKLMFILTLVTLIGFTMAMCLGTINHYLCTSWMHKATVITYQPAKCCMYLIFITRLQYIYNKSIYAFNVNLLKFYAALLIIIYSFLSIYGSINVDLYVNEVDLNGFHIVTCPLSHDLILLILSLSMDVINTVLTLVGFVSPLMKIMKSLEKHYSKNYDNEDLKYPVIKISILTSVASVTTLLTHIISIISATDTAFSIDIPLNCLCIMLMTKYYKKLYKTLCCGLIKCVLLAENKEYIEKNMQQEINQNKKPIDIDDTHYETRTLGIDPTRINYDNQSEFTQTICNL